MPEILKEKLGINKEHQNTLIQNIKQVKNNRNKTLVLVDKKGKRVYAGDINKTPGKYRNIKVKSLNKSIHKKNTLFYALLEDVKPESSRTIDSKDIKTTKHGDVYIHKLGDNNYVITPNKTFKMESGMRIYKSIEEAKKEYAGDANRQQRNKQLQTETNKNEAIRIKQEKEYELQSYNRSIQEYQSKLTNMKLNNDILEYAIRVDGKKRTILVDRKSNKMFRIKVSRGKWVEYNLTNASKRLYRLMDARKLDILK